MALRKKDNVWEVIRLRAKGEYLGKVEAPDETAALKAAVKAFAMTTIEQQKQLLIRGA